ncbi:DNA-processing protein DprA [Demequina sediminicola]|uniref:DNA-processing protein DprA n=1 Tax=Demequina sediminicola TaxID=1095026 RepID=UPI000785A46E|nr:DNA-processing protein DprA [Demequina sediminicola]
MTEPEVNPMADEDHREAARRALVVWSAIAEPGDNAAGWIVDTLGPVAALDWLLMGGEGDEGQRVRREELAVIPMPREVAAAVKASERWHRRARDAHCDILLHRAQVCGARVVTRVDSEWPSCLDSLGSLAPYSLWIRGGAVLTDVWPSGVALVGARSATAYGEHVAADLACGVVDAGRAVISGGAFGIDARAHRAALAAGGVTVALLAGGVDRLYPAANADLLTAVMRDGALVSEVPPGHAPMRSRFLQRNRLIASSAATVVVEAAMRSGALSTARHAAAMHRPVGAVPGPVTSASSAGCHALVRENAAVLVARPADVLELVAPLEACLPLELGSATHRIDFAHPHDRAVFDVVGGRGLTTDEASYRAGLTGREVLASLGRLELVGAVERCGATWRRI